MILVLGAGGNIGGELVRRLSEARVPLRAAYSSLDKAERAKDKAVETIAIDFAKPETLAPALNGVEKVFLVSSRPDLEANVVRAAARGGVRHIVKGSVFGAEGEDFSFARAHRPVERAIEESGMAWTFLRPNGFMQNLGNFFGASVKARGTFFLPAGDARVSHVDVRDIADVAARTLLSTGHEGKAYELTGPAALTYVEIARILSGALGKPVSYVDLPDAAYRKGAIEAGVPPDQADAVIDLNRYYKAGRASRLSPHVKAVTGHEPRSFETYARDFAHLFR